MLDSYGVIKNNLVSIICKYLLIFEKRVPDVKHAKHCTKAYPVPPTGLYNPAAPLNALTALFTLTDH